MNSPGATLKMDLRKATIKDIGERVKNANRALAGGLPPSEMDAFMDTFCIEVQNSIDTLRHATLDFKDVSRRSSTTEASTTNNTVTALSLRVATLEKKMNALVCKLDEGIIYAE